MQYYPKFMFEVMTFLVKRKLLRRNNNTTGSVTPCQSALLPKMGENEIFLKLLIQHRKEHPSISLVANFHRN